MGLMGLMGLMGAGWLKLYAFNFQLYTLYIETVELWIIFSYIWLSCCM